MILITKLSKLSAQIILRTALHTACYHNVIKFDNTLKRDDMPRGGKRVGAGGRSRWIHGKTKVIRVPEALADQILAIARMLDAGKSLDDVTKSKTVDLSGVSIKILKDGSVVYLQDLLKAGYKIKPVALVDKLRKDIDRGILPK